LGDGISFEKITSYEEALKSSNKLAQILEDNEGINANLVPQNYYDYDLICLLFSAYLAHLQKGNISLQGSAESTYRFVIFIPIPPQN
jgi:hypothetical protein